MEPGEHSSNKTSYANMDLSVTMERRAQLTDELNEKRSLERKLKIALILSLLFLFIMSLFLMYSYFTKLSEPPKNYFELQLRSFRAYTAAYPKSPDAHANLGFIYYQMEDYDPAVREFQTALKLDKNNLTGNFFLGLAYRKKGDEKQAIFYLSRSAAVAPARKKYTSYYELGEIYEEKGDYDEAFKAYQASIADNSTTWNSHYRLGTIYERRNQPSNALAEYKIAQKFNPKNENINNAITKIESQLKKKK